MVHVDGFLSGVVAAKVSAMLTCSLCPPIRDKVRARDVLNVHHHHDFLGRHLRPE